MKTIGERMRWLRKKRKLTQSEVDKAAKLSTGHVGSIERGRRKEPSTTTIKKIAKALDVEIGWLIAGGPAPKIKEPK